MTIFIVGLGLIGASYASRLTELNHHVYGMDHNPDVTAKALNDGCIIANDVKYMYEADLVIIALYPKATLEFIETHASSFRPNQIITDVSGVKGCIVSKIEKVLPHNVHYVSHHPMAGKEIPGYDAHDASMFMNSNVILIQTKNTNMKALMTVKTLLKTIGFSTPVTTSSENHDRLIAYTSQLPHVLAMALVHINNDDNILDYTGNSFRDLTRIASINAPLWSELFLSNHHALSDVLDDTIESLKHVQKLIKETQKETLETFMSSAKEREIDMEVIKAPSYDIVIQSHIFNNVLDTLSMFSIDTYHILVDENVYKLYKDTIEDAFDSSQYTITVIPAGEHSKSFNMVESTVDTLLKKHIKRQDYLVAIGGGVIGDLTGFIASILFRGIDYIQIPTTLLSMVDSSVGGKTAINIPNGKNLIGAFHSPKKVIIDPAFLTTLSEKEMFSGLSETLKAGLIGDAKIVEALKAYKGIEETLIARAIKVKLKFVEQDFRDYGVRHILNFGHTYGHGIEQYYKYKMTHGEAVAHGMMMALDLGVSLDITPSKLRDEIKILIDDLGLTKKPLVEKKHLIPYIKNDKKSTSDSVRFIFLKGYQTPIIKTISWNDLL